MSRVLALLLSVVVLAGTQVGAAQAGNQGQKPYSETVLVSAETGGWQATGIVLDGRSVRISATGQAECATADPAWDCGAGPNGIAPLFYQGDFLFPETNWYSLVAMIDGVAHFIGTGPVTLTGTGEIFLGYNDNVSSDNAGGYTAIIDSCRPGDGHGDTNHCHAGTAGD
jgi:hypothetical protein